MKKLLASALFVLLSVSLMPSSAFCEGGRVAVFPFKNNGQSQQGGLSSGIAAMVTTDLTRSKGLDLVDPLKVADAVAKARTAGGAPAVNDVISAAAALGADYAVTGEFVVFGGKFRIDARVYDVKTGTLFASEKAQAKEDALFDMVDALADRLIVDITGSIPAVGGALVVITAPPGASLRLDGEPAGVTPFTKRAVPAGQHKVEMELEGYKPFSAAVSVDEGGTAKVEVKMVRLYGGVRVWWKDTPSSDVSLDSEVVKAAQFGPDIRTRYCRNLPAGTYHLSVRLPYKDESAWDLTRTWKTYTADVLVDAGSVTDIFINNNLFSPGVVVGTCGSCTANWDFGADIVWYETQ